MLHKCNRKVLRIILIYKKIIYLFFSRFGHQDSVSCITSGITCDFLTGGGKDGTVRIWKTADEVQLVFNHPQSASVEALEKINAEYFTTISDNGQICVWASRKKTPLCSKFHPEYIKFVEDAMLVLFLLCVLITLLVVHRASCYR